MTFQVFESYRVVVTDEAGDPHFPFLQPLLIYYFDDLTKLFALDGVPVYS